MKDSSATHDHGNKSQSNDNPGSLEQNDDEQQCLQTLQKIFERANSIIQLLKSDDNQSNDNSAMNSLHLPKPETIDVQFHNRHVYTIVTDYTDDQRSSELYWFGIPSPSLLDDVDYGQVDTTNNPDESHEKVKCDLEDLIGKFCGNHNFFDQYKKEIIDRISKKRK